MFRVRISKFFEKKKPGEGVFAGDLSLLLIKRFTIGNHLLLTKRFTIGNHDTPIVTLSKEHHKKMLRFAATLFLIFKEERKNV